MWSETFSHPWHPTEDFTHLLPTNPPQYRYLYLTYNLFVFLVLKLSYICFIYWLHKLDNFLIHVCFVLFNCYTYKVFSEYAREIGALMDRLFSLISRGLGLDKEYLKRRIGERPSLNCQANYYPPCPKPELTMGLPYHNDFGSKAVLLQVEGVTGLQVIKDGKWLSVDPMPNTFVVNLADQIQVAIYPNNKI